MALQAFLNQIFEQHFPETPRWVVRELFCEEWTKEVLDDLLELEKFDGAEEELEYSLSDPQVVPLCSGGFECAAGDGVSSNIDSIPIPREVRVELKKLLAERETRRWTMEVNSHGLSATITAPHYLEDRDTSVFYGKLEEFESDEVLPLSEMDKEFLRAAKIKFTGSERKSWNARVNSHGLWVTTMVPHYVVDRKTLVFCGKLAEFESAEVLPLSEMDKEMLQKEGRKFADEDLKEEVVEDIE